MKLCFSPPSNTPLRKTTARCEALELADLLARHHSLTPREREVLPLLASGLLNKQVAWELGIVEYTVQIHRGNIMKMKADFSVVADKTAAEMLAFVGEHGLEGIVAKRADSVYQPGKRSGLWTKHRISHGREFVVGGYVPSHLGVDSLVVGFYRGTDLIYAGRVRAGFIPATRREVLERIKHLQTSRCPFVNLPEIAGRWGQGLTAEKMKECVWLKHEAAARIDFLEWTDANHLRHTKFVALRDDKDPRRVVRET